MRSTVAAALAAIAVTEVAAHATFQNLWINGVDYISAPPITRMKNGLRKC